MNANQKFDVSYDEENKLRYYNCAPVKRNSLTPSVKSITTDGEKELNVNKDEVFGVYCDPTNKIHYYNCAPINKQKKAGKKSPPQPIRKMFTRIFGQGDATPSGSDLSLSSNDSAPISKP